MDKKEYDIIFEGGGVKGFAFLGALKRLQEEGIGIDRAAGTSAGAVAAALIAAGYSLNQIRDILWHKDFNDFANIKIFLKHRWRIVFSRHIVDLVSLFLSGSGYGVFSTNKFYQWIKGLLKQQGVTTFRSAPRYLRVFAVDVLRQKLLQFDRDVCPDLEIAEAVRMSMSIPLFFRAKVQEEALIVDGGILANYPIDTFSDKDRLISTIGFKLISGNQALPDSFPRNIFAYLMRIFETMQVAHERIHVKEAEWARTIPIPTGNIPVIKFDLTETDKQFLWDSGYTAADLSIRQGLLTERGREK
jgi:NTE family protein